MLFRQEWAQRIHCFQKNYLYMKFVATWESANTFKIICHNVKCKIVGKDATVYRYEICYLWRRYWSMILLSITIPTNYSSSYYHPWFMTNKLPKLYNTIILKYFQKQTFLKTLSLTIASFHLFIIRTIYFMQQFVDFSFSKKVYVE